MVKAPPPLFVGLDVGSTPDRTVVETVQIRPASALDDEAWAIGNRLALAIQATRTEEGIAAVAHRFRDDWRRLKQLRPDLAAGVSQIAAWRREDIKGGRV